ncbi:MAG TPA: diguanylate cyclase [Chloroflexia bacterium]|nr:diguanylate cyclase [Chloroflexia bacterium]
MISFPKKTHFTAATKPSNSELVERLRWVIGIRWTVVIALLLVGLLGGVYKGDLREVSAPHVVLAAIVTAYNFLYLLATRQNTFGRTPFSNLVWFAQIPVDLVIFTVIIHYSGGVTGPVFVLYFLYIFVGLAILPPSGAYIVAGTAIACYGALALLEAFWLRPPLSPGASSTVAGTQLQNYGGYFLTVSAMLMIIAYIANYFAGLLTRDEFTIRRQLDEINALYSFTRAIARTVNAEEIAGTLVNTAYEMEAPNSSSLLVFNERGEGVFAAATGLSQEQIAQYQKQPLPFDHPVVQMLLAEGKGLYAPDVDDVPVLRGVLLRPSTRSFYAIPMINEGRLLGTLNLSYDKTYVLPEAHWNLLQAMTQQAALASERVRLFADTQRSAREMTSLYHIGLATISSLKIDEVLRLIYQQVKRVVDPDTFFIALYDEERAELRYDLFMERDEALPPFTARLDTMGISNWIIRTRKPVFIRHWNEEIEQMPFEASRVGTPTQSVIGVPLIAKNKIVGVMSVQALLPGAFDQNHLRLLTSIASQAALALENARLHATVNEQAQRDPLTGAYHHGTFLDKLHQAMAYAQIENQTVALIMLDIDRFKQYNDTYGHLVGDDVLRSTVIAIQGHLKAIDVVGRWGGEEFGVLLPNVTRVQARGVAERIRETVSSNVMKDMHNRSIPSPTVSQGIAMFPEDGYDIEELIDKADSALFRAKDLGRNRIAEWIDMDNSGPVSLRALP